MPGLIAELCRVFHAKRVAIECALRHQQVLADGYVMKAEFDRRWPPNRLRGRTAEIRYADGSTSRIAKLYE